jgi:hypothetical protein
MGALAAAQPAQPHDPRRPGSCVDGDNLGVTKRRQGYVQAGLLSPPAHPDDNRGALEYIRSATMIITDGARTPLDDNQVLRLRIKVAWLRRSFAGSGGPGIGLRDRW